ncbi:hypothetical protein LXL04_003891 [Taraxacum kok-saghyz]
MWDIAKFDVVTVEIMRVTPIPVKPKFVEYDGLILKEPWSVVIKFTLNELGGQTWNLVLGRRDSTTASFNDANSELPAPFLDLPQLISVFGNKGFSPQDMGLMKLGKRRDAMRRVRHRSLFSLNDFLIYETNISDH